MRFSYSLFFLFLFLVLSISSVAAIVCPSTNQFDTSIIPCEGITPVINCTDSFNATIIDLNNNSINQTFNLTLKLDNVYNFSFNLSQNSSYLITLCDDSTATITVGEFLEFYTQQTYIYIFIFIIGLALLIAGFKLDKQYMVFFGGVLFIILGLFIWANGIKEVTNLLLRRGISFILIGIGAYFMTTVYSFFEEGNK